MTALKQLAGFILIVVVGIAILVMIAVGGTINEVWFQAKRLWT